MVKYELGKWTTSTLSTLNYIYEQNEAGKRPKSKDIHNSTIMNWLYILKLGKYIDNQEGYILTDSGKHLLNELKHNPPIRTRTTKTNPPMHINKSENNIYAQISIRSNNIAFDTILPNDKAIKLVSIIMEMVKKS